MCMAFGHDFRIWQAFTPRSRRIYCDYCQQDWGMNDDARAVLPWDRELEEHYRLMGFTVRNRP